MTCDHCHAEVRPEDRFCLNCGQAVDRDPAPDPGPDGDVTRSVLPPAETTRPAGQLIDPPLPPPAPRGSAGAAIDGPGTDRPALDRPTADGSGVGPVATTPTVGSASPGHQAPPAPSPSQAPPAPPPSQAPPTRFAPDQPTPAPAPPPPPPAPEAATIATPGAPGPAVAAGPAPSRPGPTIEIGPLLLGHWPTAIRLATAMFVIQVLFHIVPGVLSAVADLVRDGVAPEPVGDFFQLPFQGVLAGNGAVDGVGLWLTGAAVVLASATIAWRLERINAPTDWIDRLLLAAKAAVVHTTILVVLSFLIEAKGLDLSSGIRLPGSLRGLASFDDWTLPRLILSSLLLVWVCLAGLQLGELAPKLPALASGLRAWIRTFVALTVAGGLLTTVARALELPSEPDVARWVAQGFDFFATAGLGLLDVGGFEVAAAVDSLFNDGTLGQLDGPWIPVLLILTVGVAVVAFRQNYREWSSRTALLVGLGAAALSGLSVLSIGVFDDVSGLATTAVLLAIVIPVLVVVTTPTALGQVRALAATVSSPSNRSAAPGQTGAPAGVGAQGQPPTEVYAAAPPPGPAPPPNIAGPHQAQPGRGGAGGFGPGQRPCRNCSNPMDDNATFCGVCGMAAV